MVTAYQDKNVEKRTKRNNAGGLTHEVTPLQQLERFLVLGAIGGTYYVDESSHVQQNIKVVENAIRDEGKAAVDLIVEVGKSNRAPKHDHVLLAYAIAVANHDTRAYALTFFNDIIRIGTHLFHFMSYYKGRGGWGRAVRRTIGEWYTSRKDTSLAFQLVKYKQRDGYSHRDVLRLAHPQAQSASQNVLLNYAVTGELNAMDNDAHRFVEAAIEATSTDDFDRMLALLKEFNLPREVLNTKFMNRPETWEALAPNMGLTALLRNLRNMHKDGYLTQGSDAVRVVLDRIGNTEDVRKSRIHPVQVYLAKFNAPEIPQPVLTALEDTFYAAFANVEPTNKRIMLALDVSGSMSSRPYNSRGISPSAREWSGLQAMVTARTEPQAEFRAFSNSFIPLNITAKDSLETVLRKISNLDFGGTDCSLPMFEARLKGELFDAFCVYTDNETWAGGYSPWGTRSRSSGDPMKELRAYRESSGIHDAKLAVVGITSTGFTIADPNDVNTLDFVGMDASAPQVMADFIRG